VHEEWGSEITHSQRGDDELAVRMANHDGKYRSVIRMDSFGMGACANASQIKKLGGQGTYLHDWQPP